MQRPFRKQETYRCTSGTRLRLQDAVSKNYARGFTIVELLIVIVVIGILAAITIVAYNGIQSRARDVKRTDDIAAIKKALELYKITNGDYPNQTPNPGNGPGFELSTDVPGTFMEYLKPFMSQVPVDPINSGNYAYWYYIYPAGYQGCDPSRGDFYILAVGVYDNTANIPQPSDFGCPSFPSWKSASGTSYVTSAFQK
jgi:general secretion pathway protein G